MREWWLTMKLALANSVFIAVVLMVVSMAIVNCRSCSQPLLPALALLPVTMVLPVVNLFRLTTWAHYLYLFRISFDCSDLQESQYSMEPFFGQVVPTDAPDIVHFGARPHACYNDYNGNYMDPVASEVLFRWRLAVAGAVLLLVSSVITTTLVVLQKAIVKSDNAVAPDKVPV